jgi:hypothetical protein
MSFELKVKSEEDVCDVPIIQSDLYSLPFFPTMEGVIPIYGPPHSGKTVIAKEIVNSLISRNDYWMIVVFCPSTRPEWVQVSQDHRVSKKFLFVHKDEDIWLDTIIENQEARHKNGMPNKLLMVWDDQLGGVDMLTQPFISLCRTLGCRARQPEINCTWIVLTQLPTFCSPAVRTNARCVFFSNCPELSLDHILTASLQNVDRVKILTVAHSFQFVCFDTRENKIYVTKAPFVPSQ